MRGTPRLLRFGVPSIGIGTYELRGDACAKAVSFALHLGYRLIDTAAVYRNEEFVGAGIVSSGVPREELFIIVKIAMKSMGEDVMVRACVLESLRKLRIAYADCVLIHWPGCGGRKPEDEAAHRAARARCWRVMQALQQEGKVRYCGVSNFLPRHFVALRCFTDVEDTQHVPPDAVPTTKGDEGEEGVEGCDVCGEILTGPAPTSSQHREVAVSPWSSTAWGAGSSPYPILNQIELHPLCVQRDVDAYCRGRHGMILQQYSPLGKGDPRLLQHPKLLEVHARYFADPSAAESPDSSSATAWYSVPDIVLMWGLAQGFSTLVRSSSTAHLQANLAAARDFEASVVAVAAAAGDVDSVLEVDARLASAPMAMRSRPLLTAEQLTVIRELRTLMGVEGKEELPDVHLCWYSSEIA